MPSFSLRTVALAAAAAAVLALSTGAAAAPVEDAVNPSTFDWTAESLTPIGFSPRVLPSTNSRFNSDLAFWGNRAYHGHYDGFRIVDISDPANPVELVNYTQCAGDQGDVLIWEQILVRSWNSAATAATCGGLPVVPGFEGLHVFDVSNPASPTLVASVNMSSTSVPSGCGSHTATLVPDVARGNLYVYDSASSGSCPGIDIVKIPIANPAAAAFVRREPSGRSCHDTGVILGEVNLVACAGGNGFTVYSIDPRIDPPGTGSLEDPVQLYSRTVTGVSIGHSAAFSYDGKILVFGHEPGGGSQAQCQATSSVVNRSLFFFDARTGTQLGTFLMPRPQTSAENCTWHNYNIVPTNRKHVLVSGNYQAGVVVVDFTDPANAKTIGYADPKPLTPTRLGGDWSSYWHNGFVFEADITRGLIIWRLHHRATDGARTLGHQNPQTQEFSFALDRVAPTTVATVEPEARNGWFVRPTVTLTATDDDGGAGVDRTEYRIDGGEWTTYTGPFDVLGDGNRTIEYRSTDFADNVEAANTLELRVDATTPTITLSSPVDGRDYVIDSALFADFACADATSGVERCEGTQPNGSQLDTSSIGTRTFRVDARDVAGNEASASATYRIIWPFAGFFSPVGTKTVQAGNAVPMKFTLGGDRGLDVLLAGFPKSRPIDCADGLPLGGFESTSSQFGLTFDGDKYVYVWQTQKAWAGTCREFSLGLADGTERTARFAFKA